MPDEEDLNFPPLIMEEEVRPALQVPVQELPIQDRIEHSMAIVRAHHERIAKGLALMWGYPECNEYLQKLVFDGSDPADTRRAGFKPEVLEALLSLLELHRVGAR